MAGERQWVTPYNYVQNNPVNRIDPNGAIDDWVQGTSGDIRWDKNANSQATTQPGETYLGRTLTFTFNSYIDAKLWDGPNSNAPGDKLTSTIRLTGNENAGGELTSLTATKKISIGSTPIGTGRDYFPDLGEDQNKFGFTKTENSTTLNFEQHASVSKIEEVGLKMLGYDIVNVAQKLTLGLSDNKLSISASTDVFPSATLSVNGKQLFKYDQPSFEATHGKSSSFTDNGMGGVNTRDESNRSTPTFNLRYKK